MLAVDPREILCWLRRAKELWQEFSVVDSFAISTLFSDAGQHILALVIKVNPQSLGGLRIKRIGKVNSP